MPSQPSSSSSSSTTAQASKSGIITSTTGERHIPSSQRADGSTRREIKIRPGYRPPEDIETYKNRTAEAWKTRGKRVGVPGAATMDDDDDYGKKKAGTGVVGQGKSSTNVNNKNAKRREARRRAKETAAAAAAASKAGGGGDDDELSSGVANEEAGAGAGGDVEGGLITAVAMDGDAQSVSQNAPTTSSDDLQQEREREARKLQKKLRQARELREKKDNGGHLLPEQLEKVIRINELLRQLNSLGFDPE